MFTVKYISNSSVHTLFIMASWKPLTLGGWRMFLYEMYHDLQIENSYHFPRLGQILAKCNM